MTHLIQRIFNGFFESNRTCCFTVEKGRNHKNNFFLNISLYQATMATLMLVTKILGDEYPPLSPVFIPFADCNKRRIHQVPQDRNTLSFELNLSELDLLTA